MKNCLLLLAVVGVMMMVGAPAYSQYLFLDTNGDGRNSTNPIYYPPNPPPDPPIEPDVLSSTVTSIDIYLVTDQNVDGTPATCQTGETFQINSYEFILRYSGTGSVQYGAWTDNMGYANGGVLCGDAVTCKGAGDIWVGKYKFTYDPPGRYKLGSLAITVTGTPDLDFMTTSTLHPLAGTSFGSSCSGSQGDHTIRLGVDFCANGELGCPGNTQKRIPVTTTTWGKIKVTYK